MNICTSKTQLRQAQKRWQQWGVLRGQISVRLKQLQREP
jgi:hypothetical protein